MEALIAVFVLFILLLCVVVGFMIGAAAIVLKMVKSIVKAIGRIFDVF